MAWEEGHVSAALDRMADVGSGTRRGQLGPEWEALAARATLPRDTWEGLSPFLPSDPSAACAPEPKEVAAKGRAGRPPSAPAPPTNPLSTPPLTARALGSWVSRGHCVGSAGGSPAWPPRAGGDETPPASAWRARQVRRAGGGGRAPGQTGGRGFPASALGRQAQSRPLQGDFRCRVAAVSVGHSVGRVSGRRRRPGTCLSAWPAHRAPGAQRQQERADGRPQGGVGAHCPQAQAGMAGNPLGLSMRWGWGWPPVLG